MTAYAAIFSARFRMLLQYRAAAAAGVGTQLFWGLIRVMIFTAFYESSSAPKPMPLPDLITYLWLIQALIMLSFANVDTEVRAMIQSGNVAYELIRPLDLYTLWYVRAMAARIAPTLLRAIPIFVIAGLFLGLRPPPSLPTGLAWLLATCGAACLSAALSTLVTISLLYTVAGDGIQRLMPTLTYALSGMLVPLPLLPVWLQKLFNLLPFSAMMDAPFRLYIGHLPLQQTGSVLARQLIWTAAFILFGRAILERAKRRVIVQGG